MFLLRAPRGDGVSFVSVQAICRERWQRWQGVLQLSQHWRGGTARASRRVARLHEASLCRNPRFYSCEEARQLAACKTLAQLLLCFRRATVIVGVSEPKNAVGDVSGSSQKSPRSY